MADPTVQELKALSEAHEAAVKEGYEAGRDGAFHVVRNAVAKSKTYEELKANIQAAIG